VTRGAPSRAPPARNGASGSVAPATVLDHGAVDASGIVKGALAREGQYVLDLTPDEWTAIALSLRIALVATAVGLPFGVAVAWLLARKDFWGKSLFDGIIHLPLVLPPVVTGYLLLISFGRRGPIGAFLADYLGIVLSFRWTGAALACGIMGFPLMVRAIRLSIEAVDRRLEDAASTLGANRFWNFVTITLPLALPGILAGTVLAFARALGEFGATITFVSNIPGETQTISAAIYTLMQVPGGDAAALRLVTVSVLISLAALLASDIFARRAAKRLHGD
jgi:molybdate transport system permease protein